MKLPLLSSTILAAAFVLAAPLPFASAADTVVFEGKEGPGKGKSLVFMTGDEEYRSEQGLTQLAKILAERQGFKCTVLYSVNPKTGEIDPETKNNMPGIEALDTADGVVMLLRFRELPDEQMKHFVDYLNAGKPIVALRTSTHAFNYAKDSKSEYKKFHWQSSEWPGGFGKQVLGETWVAHHGAHKKEATRGVIEEANKSHPVLRGVSDLFGTSDVYTANPPADSTILVRGQVLTGMNATDEPVAGQKNSPMQPIVWTREWKSPTGNTAKVVTTTMGAATDLENEGLRRLVVNAVLWEQGLPVPEKADVALVGEYKPLMYGFRGHQKGVKPADLQAK